ncbi:hypothetical protein SteCoe_7519 [Stentor coeruleus]|uniref:Uncharacterized protein n=1 Tax=Stentor coeruleus TaxID=5963 RepID=A0A1R2CMK3_9CILI|nr:hypothetical protein SteCoe_7519 [Stentor coeruleus]
MGCCITKEEEKANTEAEGGINLISRDVMIDEKSPSHKEDTYDSVVCFLEDFEKTIDGDQYLTMKILECLSLICSRDSEAVKKISSRVTELVSLKTNSKLVKYFDLRIEETEIEKKCVKTIEENCKALQSIVGIKYTEIDERIDSLNSIIGHKNIYCEERDSLKMAFSQINKVQKPELGSLINDLKDLLGIEKSLGAIERSLPKLNEDSLWLMRLKDLELSLGTFVKSSLNTLKNIEHIFGNCQNTEKVDVISLQNFEINTDTYTTLVESLKSWISNLHELEILKDSSITSNNIIQQLRNLDEKLSIYFFNAEGRKQSASDKFRRMSRKSTGLGMFIHEVLKHIDTTNKTLEETANQLCHKVNLFIKTAETQDNIITDMTDKLSDFDKKIDEIELKFSDYIENLSKELQKSTPIDEIDIRDNIDEIKKKIMAKEGLDMIERLELLSMKIDFACEFVNIFKDIKELIAKDHVKGKNEILEKNNELSGKLALCENDKKNLKASIENLRLSYEKSCEITEKMTKGYAEKDMELASLKGSFSALTKNYDEVLQDKSREEEELENLTVQLRECKKALRAKESELNELKASVEQN